MRDKNTCDLWPDCGCQPEEDCKVIRSAVTSFTASPASGGPAGAPQDEAFPAAPAIGPGEAVNALKARGEAILAEMRAVLDRSDDALWMVKRELEHRADLIDAAFSAHVDMGFVQRDLRALVKDL
jgi:hypothetical protein